MKHLGSVVAARCACCGAFGLATVMVGLFAATNGFPGVFLRNKNRIESLWFSSMNLQ